MTAPTIHANGTSRQSLADGYSVAYGMLELAYQAMKETAPNGRDYKTHGAFVRATAEHMRIDEVKAELERLIAAIET